MEIDLNHAVTEVEKNAFCTNGDSSSSSCSSNSSPSPMPSSIYLELWHACAGPLTSLPKKGNVVVYFPQGHLEQVASSAPFSPMEMPTFDLQPQIFCKVVNVQFLANKENDEVYTQLTLLPQSEDYKQQRPSQELVAKDLHGVEWRFRHIYRGQPRRHLLTTGWSIFVSQKNLVSGDAVLFLRGEDGELRLGIRRAVRPRNGLPDSVVGKQNSYPSVLSLVANAISTKSMFNVLYSPRCSGVVTGMSDLDPYRWPNSKWRCLMVRWDEDVVSDHQERVSLWEIDPSVSLPPLSIQSSPRLKKLRTGLPANPPDNPITGGGGFLDFEESGRSSKVLQGQENVGFVSPLYGHDTLNRPPDFEMQNSAHQNLVSTGRDKANISEITRARSTTYTGFAESNRFPKVLQGQEICPLRSLTGKSDFNLGAWGRPNLRCGPFNIYQAPRPNFYPLAAESFQNMYFPYADLYKTGQDPRMCSYATNFPREKLQFGASSIQTGVARDEVGKPNQSSEHKSQETISASPALGVNLINQKDNSFNGTASGCKLFGFSLTAESPTPNSQNSGKRSCTKVHKQGSLVGRAIDLSRLNGYDDLLSELERLFSMEGFLRDHKKGWRILYTDSENDVMVVGDDPWHEFCNVVSKIHIYTQEEVEKMTIGVIGDDTQSCLDQAHVVMEASKSSSVGQPDSSPQ
ncbi:hypothetical protein GH714_002743 [Hevea brasiliensis]|uniref:Auxin response factor n=1 Tax=Hevea brasiliensis TaxID=3981 RepID=A0A6A6NBV7_HEVBR|nr:hypothetical protein GH714_002743 [Hevea brasiliensis]